MSEITVDLVTPRGMTLEGTVRTGDTIVAEAVAALVREPRLSVVSSTGTRIEYRFDRPHYGQEPAG
jgi:ATP-dependent 26S proteasome regulatory subunit